MVVVMVVIVIVEVVVGLGNGRPWVSLWGFFYSQVILVS